MQKKVAMLFLALSCTLLLLAPILSPKVTTQDNAENSIEISVTASPPRIQEGENTTITIDVSQAEPSRAYTFGINVTNPGGTFSVKNITITSDASGSGANSTDYWRDFAEANTDYVGTYLVAVRNVTNNEVLTTGSFSVGLTDKLKYARNETVSIQGSGYSPGKNVTVNVKFNETQFAEQNVTANSLGVANYSWQVSSNATSGLYTVSITNATEPSIVKIPPDVQDFYVEVWQVQIWARNLAYEPLDDLNIKAYNNTIIPEQFLNVSQKTNETGQSSFMLARGNYTFKAFWKQVEVGNFSSYIENDTVLDPGSWVQLSNLRITVKDGATDENLPFIQLVLEHNYTTDAGKNVTEKSLFETNFTGTVHAHNLFVNINYAIKAKRYGLEFPPVQNRTLLSPWNTMTIEFPVYTVSFHVIDVKGNFIKDVAVKAYEWSSGLRQSGTTNPDGNVSLSLTFGKYRVKAYKNEVLLNETVIDLILNQSSFILHLSTFNVDLTVRVIDYFGQPLPNAVVKVEQKALLESVEGISASDGKVNFNDILGGDSRISVSIRGTLGGIKDLYLIDSEQVTFKLSSYAAVAGYAMEISQFVTVIALVVFVVALIVAMTYKRLLRTSLKSE